MQQFRRILVGIDLAGAAEPSAAALGEPTREAIKRAVWLAGHLNAKLTFFAAEDIARLKEELSASGTNLDDTQLVQSAQKVLDELVEEAKQAGVSATGQIEFGRPWEAMIRAVLRDGHDLVIVGTRDRGTASRVLFGSTAMKLLRNCPCPVWVTRPDPDWEDLNILVASDLSDVSQRALDLAVGGAQLADAKIHLLHATENTHERRMWLTGMRDDELRAAREHRHKQVEEQLHEQLAQTDYRTLSFGVQVHVVDGAPDIAVLNAIDEYEIDLLIMGTVARSGVAGLVIGNTAEQLLAQVPCSVLAIKPADFQCPVEAESG